MRNAAPGLMRGTGTRRSPALAAVACPSSTACTAVAAVGHHGSDANSFVLAERWNGKKWTIRSTPNQPRGYGNYLAGVACPSSAVCTAVGNYKHRYLVFTLAER